MQAIRKPVRRLVRASRCSLAGLRCALREEAFRLELFVSAILAPLAFFMTSDGVERVLLIAAIGLVLITEVLNTAIERAVDRIGLENHKLSRDAKDLGSAAVFISILLAALIWGMVLTL